jgi:osmoprotectant transport system permease protein
LRPVVLLVAATAALLLALAGAGSLATAKIAVATSPAARVSLGAAFWIVVVASSLAISDALAAMKTPLGLRALFATAIIALMVAFAANGWFADLSLVHEWANRREAYGMALRDHVALVVTALVLALLVGVPLGIVSVIRGTGRIFGVLSLLQTIPSIALFALLIGPLSALSASFPFLRELGINGIGFAPAVIALVLYALLPVARNTEAALRSVPAAVLDTARGMGMTNWQSLLHVTLPLASPILLAGLRIVVVQLVGLTVVAALIGAGGLGSFVFLGLGQTATDMVLLGALSAIAIAIVADAALRLLTAAALARVGQ